MLKSALSGAELIGSHQRNRLSTESPLSNNCDCVAALGKSVVLDLRHELAQFD